jgi:hypothetical protein
MTLDIRFNGPKLEPVSLSKSRTFSRKPKKVGSYILNINEEEVK